MRDENDIDGGKRVEADTGRVHPARSDERQRARAFGPHRIDENVATPRLDQERSMTYMRDARPRPCKARRRAIGLEGAWVGIGPGRPAIGQLPPEDCQLALGFHATWIEEPSAVELVGNRDAVVGIG